MKFEFFENILVLSVLRHFTFNSHFWQAFGVHWETFQWYYQKSIQDQLSDLISLILSFLKENVTGQKSKEKKWSCLDFLVPCPFLYWYFNLIQLLIKLYRTFQWNTSSPSRRRSRSRDRRSSRRSRSRSSSRRRRRSRLFFVAFC